MSQQVHSVWRHPAKVIITLSVAWSLPTHNAWSQSQDSTSLSLRQAITQAASAIRGELLKAATADKAVKEGLAAYREQQRLQEATVGLSEKMTQPDLLCHDLGARDVITEGNVNGRAATFRASLRHRSQAASVVNPVAHMGAMHQGTNAKFCDASDERQGICKMSTSPAYANLAGADRDALYLFQSRSGGETYDGNRQGGQVEATSNYIARVVHGPNVPPTLQAIGAAGYTNNPQARTYVESQRRYDAFLSMARYSLTRIQESRMPKN